MPETFLNQKDHSRITSFIINSNIDINNFQLNSEINISGNTNNNVFINIKPPFPPTLTINDLIKNALKSSKPKSIPNAFIAYRMALINEYHIQGRKLLPMGKFSKIAKNSWNKEPKYIKEFYDSLVKDAKSFYRQNKMQIVLDKHMDESTMEVDFHVSAESDTTRVIPVKDAICTENSRLLIQDSVVSAENSSHKNNVSFPNIDFAEMNLTLNDQEYIRMLEQENKMLEQVIDCLLKN